MNGFDSYRVRERADVARWILVGRVPGAVGRVLPHADHPARQVPAQGRDQPAPADLADAAPRRDPRPAGPDHRGERARATRSSCSRPTATRSAPCWRGWAGSCRSTRPTSRRSSAASPQARYQPVVVFGDATFETVARLEEHRAVLPGLVIQSEPKRLYPGGQGGRPPGGLRLGGDRVRPHRQPLPRRGAGLDRGQGRARARVRRHPAGRRGRALHRGERPRPAGARGGEQRLAAAHARASRSAPRSISTSSGSSTASGRRASGARWSR